MLRTPQDTGRRGSWLVIALAMTVALAGCDCTTPRGKPWRHDPDPQELAAAQPRSPALARDPAAAVVLAERDHTLRIQMDAEPRAINPLVAPSVWARRIALGTVFETLIRYEPPDGGAGAGNGRYAPGLAHSWRIMPGGQEIRFYLEQGITFHDGRALTSVDVQFTLDAVRDPRNNVDHLRPALAKIWAVEIITSREVRVVLNEPDAWVLRALAEIPILPYHVYKDSLSAGGRIVGSGPWQLKSWKDRVVHLTRYGRYWGPAPAISDLEFVYERDAARALTEAKRGGYDLIPALIPAHWPEQATSPGTTAAFAPLELAPPRMYYLAFHCGTPPLDDPRVRQAIALLLDRTRYARDAMDGLGRPVAGPVWPGGPGDGPSPPAPEQDPIAAGRLLDEAGWIDSDQDGVRDRAGQRLHIVGLQLIDDDQQREVNPSGPTRVDPWRAHLIEPLERAGIAVDFRPAESEYFMNRVRAGDFGMAFLEMTQPVDTDLRPLLGAGGNQNYGGCTSRRVEQALDALRGEWEPAGRGPRWGELASALAESWPVAGIVAAAPQGLVHRRVEGVVVWDGWIDLRRLRFAPVGP